MRGILKGLLVAAALTALANTPAKAQETQTISDNGVWNEFVWNGGPCTPFQDADYTGNTVTFAFTLTHPDVLRITDAFQGGDQFEVILNGADVGATSPTPGFGPFYLGDCWTCAYYDTTGFFTHGFIDLAAGSYTVTGFIDQTPQYDGAGAIELGAVPEPASWAMMLAGFFGLGAVLRRARREQRLAATA